MSFQARSPSVRSRKGRFGIEGGMLTHNGVRCRRFVSLLGVAEMARPLYAGISIIDLFLITLRLQRK